MKIQVEPTDKKPSTFFYLLLLMACFLFLEISFFVQTNKAYLFDLHIVTHQLHVPLSVITGVVFFVAAQLLIHIAYCLLILLISHLMQRVLKLTAHRYFLLTVTLWSLGLVGILAANQYYFPNSRFSGLSAMLWWNSGVAYAVMMTVLMFSVICMLIAALGFLLYLQSCSLRGRCSYLALIFAGVCFFSWQSRIPNALAPISVANNLRPNIIIIGVDALRPDFLSFFGADTNTPTFDQFLNQAAVFSEAITPLARTFPSWVSILTGEYPLQTGMRFNLANQAHLDYSEALPTILQKLGYHTLFATDETRFSNINTRYGFDKVITPPMGLNDFLLGSFNDFPISNLLINTKLGAWLFPYSYANRAAFVTYQPASFINQVANQLSNPSKQPIFLAIHFCLPHFPYLWSQHLAETDGINNYQNAVITADQQVGSLLALLQAKHLLQHAIVVLLSDHGEALELPGDRITDAGLFVTKAAHPVIPHFYPPSLDIEAVNQSAGHGTDVLGLSQYHTVLAVRLYGAPQTPREISGVVSLLDIKPTLLNFLQQPYTGTSLKPVITNPTVSISSQRDFFLESDYSPAAIRTLYPDVDKAMLEGIGLFQVDPGTAKLVVKDTMAAEIIRSKQLADIYQNWVLALYPQNQTVQMPILVNLITGQWTNDLHSSFAQHSPYLHMLKALKSFYGSEVDKNILALE